MSNSLSYFEAIRKKMSRYKDVGPGKMMSAEAIKYKGKVFAFYNERQMGFKLGKGYDISPFGIEEFSYLSPFKNKPPMKAWFMIPDIYHELWLDLSKIALEEIKKTVK